MLPAEYGIDPLHTGRALGLMSLAKATAAAPSGAPAETRAYQKAAVTMAQPTTAGEAPVITGVFVPEPARYKVDSREIKSRLSAKVWRSSTTCSKDAGMVLLMDGKQKHPIRISRRALDVKPAGAAARTISKATRKTTSTAESNLNGTFTAPSTGIEG